MSNNFNTKASSKVIKGLGTASLFFILMGCSGGGDGGGSGNNGLTAQNPPSSTVNLKMEELIIPEDFSFQAYKDISFSMFSSLEYANIGFDILVLNIDDDAYSYESVGSAFTDNNGNYKGSFRIPSNQDIVYIRLNRPGINDIEAAVLHSEISISSVNGSLVSTL